ncbi:MAG TPA: hypothetical protein VGW38_27130, partial [Chloroflexota bacterium]|nr:hypothetical protein [Chloroflexota bacterium]
MPDNRLSQTPSVAALSPFERGCWIAFNRTPGIGVTRFRRLLDRFGALEQAWRAPRAELATAGLDRRSLDALVAARAHIDPARELDRALSVGARAITWRDPEYPALLAAIPDPPPVLYVKGTLND